MNLEEPSYLLSAHKEEAPGYVAHLLRKMAEKEMHQCVKNDDFFSVRLLIFLILRLILFNILYVFESKHVFLS